VKQNAGCADVENDCSYTLAALKCLKGLNIFEINLLYAT